MWDLEVGDTDSRTNVQARHGGSNSRGISAPARASDRDNVMLWWDPDRGEDFGYADGWTDAGAFYYSGTGVEGDQSFDHPHHENGRVRDHAKNGDQVRLLRYVGKNKVCYVGELRLDPKDPWRWVDGFDQYRQRRRMIQFRFLPVGHVLRLPSDEVRFDVRPAPASAPLEAPMPEPSQTALEALKSPAFRRCVQSQDAVARRQEAKLVHEFAAWLALERQVDAVGLEIPYKPEGRNLRADLFVPPSTDHAAGVLIEAKSTAARENLRLAIGQLLDYARYLEPKPLLAVLLPSEPPPDMVALLIQLGIGPIWQHSTGFVIDYVPW